MPPIHLYLLLLVSVAAAAAVRWPYQPLASPSTTPRVLSSSHHYLLRLLLVVWSANDSIAIRSEKLNKKKAKWLRGNLFTANKGEKP